jgi:hypothetical protein
MDNGVGVTVTLREIYDAAQRGAQEAAGARGDVAALRRDFQTLDKRLAAVEVAQKGGTSVDVLRKAGYAVGLLASGVAAGWVAIKGG